MTIEISNVIIEKPLVDLSELSTEEETGTDIIELVKREVVDFCKEHLAVGNERDAGFSEFSFDLSSQTVHFKIWIKSKHKTNGITIYSVSYDISGEYNLRNISDSALDTEICVSTPVGRMCIKAKSIIEIFMKLMG
ncbi:hypothetical protein AB9M91_03165 [Bacillus safensis]|uniref:hypothetical protein n=1 Tax=Bacillus safensis TaxID=561879 RepID=UPI003517A3AE